MIAHTNLDLAGARAAKPEMLPPQFKKHGDSVQKENVAL